MISLPVAIAALFATWIFAAGLTYGVMKSWKESAEARMDAHARELEAIRRDFLPRIEFQNSREDMTNRLERIERKIDNLK